MPWRRQPKLYEDILSRVGERSKNPPVVMLATTEVLLERTWALTRVIALAVLVLFVFLIALQVQISDRNHNIEKVGQAAKDAREASVAAKTALDGAIKQSQDPAVLRPFLDMVKRTERIEQKLCGGPCPEK